MQQCGLLCLRQIREPPLWSSSPLQRERFLIQRMPNHVVFISPSWKEFTPPFPLKPPIACLSGTVEIAHRRADGFINHRVWLQPAGDWKA